jgi:hypothetical protein
MTVAALRADCARCAALCCVALAFDRSHLFAFDKAAGEVCPNLDSCGRCRIHAAKARAGFAGCVDYDCLGAGQRVTQEVFGGGHSWREHPELLAPMLSAFALLRRIHELLLLLREAQKLPLSAKERKILLAFEEALDPPAGWSVTSLGTVPLEAMAAEVRAFLMSLRRHVTRSHRGAA